MILRATFNLASVHKLLIEADYLQYMLNMTGGRTEAEQFEALLMLYENRRRCQDPKHPFNAMHIEALRLAMQGYDFLPSERAKAAMKLEIIR